MSNSYVSKRVSESQSHTVFSRLSKSVSQHASKKILLQGLIVFAAGGVGGASLASAAPTPSQSAQASSSHGDARTERSDSSASPLKQKIGPISAKQRQLRLQHARELLGSRYKKSVVRTGEGVEKINGAVYRWTREALPAKHKAKAQKVAQAILDESLKHGFDPVFVMSIIHTESSFDPDQLGSVGEIGLMQIRPETAKWIAQKAGLRWKGKNSLKDPVTNIRLGTAFLAYLQSKFDSHARLYLAAYNMGRANVLELRDRGEWPKVYPAKVMSAYIDYYTSLKRQQKRTDREVASPRQS